MRTARGRWRFQTQSTGLRNLRTRELLESFRFKLPPPDTQRRIGAELAAFDELARVNWRRIELLEGLARSLYREWFVDFRFPGHDDGTEYDPSAGSVPGGWSIGCVGDLAALATEAVKPSEFQPGETYVGLEHLPRRRTTLRRWGSADSVTSQKLRFFRGDTLFGKIRPYFHKVCWAPFEGIASADTIVLRPHEGRDTSAFVNAIASSDRLVARAVATSNGTKCLARIRPSCSATTWRFQTTTCCHGSSARLPTGSNGAPSWSRSTTRSPAAGTCC